MKEQKYIYNNQTLQYEPITNNNKFWKNIAFIGGVGITSIVLLSLPSSIGLSNQEVIIQPFEYHPFSESLLQQEIQKLNLPFSNIIIAQSKLETGNYTSERFKCSNNLFGQKQATIRVNCQNGEYKEHAYYDNWVLSLYDYGFWFSTYASKVKTEDEYLNFLGQIYAEDPQYVTKLKQIMGYNKDGNTNTTPSK